MNEFKSASDVMHEMESAPEKPKKTRMETKPPVQSERQGKPEVGTTQRKKRIPVYKSELEKTKTRKGYHRRWVNDEGDNLHMYEQGGYTKVQDHAGNTETRRAKPGVKAVLMEIPEELHDEDQQAKYDEWNAKAHERLKSRENEPGYYAPGQMKHIYRSNKPAEPE